MFLKGSGLRSLLAAIEKLHGHAGLERVLAVVPEDVRVELRKPILPVKWYPIAFTTAIHAAVRETLGNGDWSESKRLGHEAALQDFGGVYRVLLRSVHYDTLWDRIQVAFSQYHSQGKGEWIDRRPGGATGLITGVVGYNLGQWLSIAGRCERLILMSGAKSAQADLAEPTSTSCRIEVMYFD
jgi:hypothetical protein